jgi:hypothetical protein
MQGSTLYARRKVAECHSPGSLATPLRRQFPGFNQLGNAPSCVAGDLARVANGNTPGEIKDRFIEIIKHGGSSRIKKNWEGVWKLQMGYKHTLSLADGANAEGAARMRSVV